MASYDDVDIFGPPTPLPDIGYGLEPMEPTPAMNRRDIVANYLQKIGYDPRRSYQMAEKMVGTGEMMGEFVGGASEKLARERGDKLGIALSYLDYMAADPRLAVPTAIAKKVAKKGITSLDQTKKMIEADVDEYARSYLHGGEYGERQPQVSPTIKALIEKAPPNLKGKQIIEWLHGNYKKGVKPQELEHLGLDEFIAQNPNATMREAIQHASDNKVLIQKRYRRGDDDAPTIEFEKSTPDTDPLDGSDLWRNETDDILYDIANPTPADEYLFDELLSHYNKEWKMNYKSFDEIPTTMHEEVADSLAKQRYKDNPYELIEPVSVGAIDANIGRNTFAFGNDDVGYQLFVDGERVTNYDNVAFSRTEAELQLRDKMQEGGDLLRMEGDEIWDVTHKQWVDDSLPGGSNYREVVFAWDEAPITHNITDHFPDEDAIASALIRDRKLADGKNSLHVDELQSDLHTAGSKSGYATPEAIDKLDKEYVELYDNYIKKYKPFEKKMREEILAMIKKYPNKDGPKKILSHFEEVNTRIFKEGDPSSSYFDAHRNLRDFIVRHNFDQDFNARKFLDVVGQEYDEVSLANKILKNRTSKRGVVPNYPFKEDYHVMGLKQLLLDAVSEGKDTLSVSGSFPIKQRYADRYAVFYETLYDKKIPSAMKKLANKYGGKFEKGSLDLEDTFGSRGVVENTPSYTADEIAKAEINIIHITPEMKEKILKEGVELFGKGGQVGGTLDKPLEGNTREIM